MKHLLRYLIPIIFAAVTLTVFAKMSDSSLSSENQTTLLTSEIDYQHIDPYTHYFDIDFQCRFLGARTNRLHSARKRTSNTNKANFDFIKDSNAPNAGINNFIPKNSSNIHVSFTKPIHRLIRFGKLII